MYHIPTAFFIIGLLYIFLPIVVWLALKHQTSQTVTLWCLGGGVLAVGLVLIAGRQVLPSWLTYTVANFVAWIGIGMQATALRNALQKKWALKWAALLVVFWIAVFEYFRSVLQSPDFRFAWGMAFYVGVFLYIAFLAWQIAQVHELSSGYWLSAVYLMAALGLVVRMALVLMNWTEPDVVAQGADSILTVVTGILISVIGSFTFVSMFLERAAKRELLQTEQRARREEQVRLSEQIAQLERQRTLGAMSYSFAHELSQPLTAILMDAQTMHGSLQEPALCVDDLSNSLAEIERSATRTVDLIDRIRNFIRPTHGDYKPVDMKALVVEVQELLAHDIRSQNVVFAWDFDEADCVVSGNKVQLSQIVLNVYRNAIQAMADVPHRKIDVMLEREGMRVVLRVHDSGLGLDASKKDQLGQPFVTTKTDGLGVGLAISITIAEMHGGRLSIANAIGGGALVELSLPALVL